MTVITTSKPTPRGNSLSERYTRGVKRPQKYPLLWIPTHLYSQDIRANHSPFVDFPVSPFQRSEGHAAQILLDEPFPQVRLVAIWWILDYCFFEGVIGQVVGVKARLVLDSAGHHTHY
jgi:hypothetical protein